VGAKKSSRPPRSSKHSSAPAELPNLASDDDEGTGTAPLRRLTHAPAKGASPPPPTLPLTPTKLSARPTPPRPATKAPPAPEPPETVRLLPDSPSGELPSLADEDGTSTDRTAMIEDLSTRTSGKPTLTILTGLSSGHVIHLGGAPVTIGRGKEVDVVLRDVGVSRQHARVLSINGCFILEDLGSTNGLRTNGVRVKTTELKAGDRVQLGPEVLLQFAFLDDAEENLTKRLYVAATRDPLTQALNRRALEDRLSAECSYAGRHKTRLSIVIFDIDHFKRVNDTYGHPVGDLVLREVADIVRATLRDEDAFARYGGEEFVILVRGETTSQTAIVAERVRRAIGGLAIKVEGGSILRVTVSAGVAELEECGAAGGPDALIELADRRLYVAKTSGRDRTCTA